MGAGASSSAMCTGLDAVDAGEVSAANANFEKLLKRAAGGAAAGDLLLNKLGGEAALKHVIDLFYNILEAHPETKPFFEHYDMKLQRQRQFCYLSYVFSGGMGHSYKGRNLTEAHAHLIRDLGFSDRHIDIGVEAMKQVLSSLNVPQELVDEVLAIIEDTRELLLGRKLQSWVAAGENTPPSSHPNTANMQSNNKPVTPLSQTTSPLAGKCPYDASLTGSGPSGSSSPPRLASPAPPAPATR